MYPTHEFAFAIMVKCPERLIEGDTVTLTIGDAGWPATYQVGDVLTLPVIAAAPLELAGGVDGDDTLTWTVRGSVLGALADYTLTALEPSYANGGIHLALHRGALPFALGDVFTFGVETGGQFRWRVNGGAWSADTAIADSVALANGLAAAFIVGATPSFVPADAYAWQVEQPYSPSAVRQPIPGLGHQWIGANQTLRVDLGTVQALSAVGVALHTLPGTASVILAGSVDDATYWTEPLTVADGPLVKILARSARWVELRITGASGAAVGWWWLGQAWSPSGEGATTVRLSRQYQMARGSGVNPAGVYLGRGIGGELQWSVSDNDWLENGDLTELWTMLDHVKSQGDEPLLFVPHYLQPSEAALVVVDSDAVSVEDLFRFHSDAATDRVLSVTLPLRGVIG